MNMAKDPFHQLAIIRKASHSGRIIRDCYRLMYHRQIWEAAYANLNKQKQMTTVQFEADIELLMKQLRIGSFRLSDSNEQKKLLVQEVIRLILESIFEPIFLENTAIFIRENNFHQALITIKNTWFRNNWCMKIEIKELLDLNQSLLMDQFKKKIKDHRFIHLIHHALHLDIFQDTQNPLRLLCMEIQLHTLDFFIFQQQHHAENIQYLRWKQMLYIGTAGSKQTIYTIQKNLQNFLRRELNIDVNDASIYIHHLEKPTAFGAYTFRRQKQTNRNLNIIKLEIPANLLKLLVRKHRYGNLESFTMKSRTNLIHKSEIEILKIYNQELIEIANYYRFANNYPHLGKLFYLAEGSFIKTIAQKRKITFKKATIWLRNQKQSAIVKLKDL